MNSETIYPSQYDHFTVYLKNAVKTPFIEIGDYTILHDFLHDPLEWEKNSVLYHYPKANGDRLKIVEDAVYYVAANTKIQHPVCRRE